MRITHSFIAAALVASAFSTSAVAQGTPGSGTGNGTIDTSYGEPQQRQDDDGFPWGLLGLLGLAGLLPRKKHHRVDVDNRTTRP